MSYPSLTVHPGVSVLRNYGFNNISAVPELASWNRNLCDPEKHVVFVSNDINEHYFAMIIF
jgi:hypothetical protein